MENGGNQRQLPKTRIGELFIAINRFSFFVVAIAAVPGVLAPLSKSLVHWHIPMGLGAAVLGLFSLVSAMFYLVVTGQMIKEAVQKRKISADLFGRTKQFKKELFPWCMGAIVLLITMTVLGGAVHVGKISKYVHLGFAALTLAVYWGAIKSMKRNFDLNRELIADTIDAVNALPASANS